MYRGLWNRVNFNADGGAGGGADGADSGAVGDQGGQQGDNLGWRAALPVEYRDHEFVKGFSKPGDFVKAALEVKTSLDGLQGKLANAIIKPGENATSEEIAAYHKAIGVPETPDAYDLPKTEGVEHDERMTAWARGVFHEAKLNGEQAALISRSWDNFVQELDAAQDAAIAAEIEAATEALKGEWKADYDKNIKLTERGYQAFEKVVPGFADLLGMEISKGVRVGNDARMLKVFHAIGSAIGDDLSLPFGQPQGAQKPAGGFESIYKTPNPPKV